VTPVGVVCLRNPLVPLHVGAAFSEVWSESRPFPSIWMYPGSADMRNRVLKGEPVPFSHSNSPPEPAFPPFVCRFFWALTVGLPAIAFYGPLRLRLSTPLVPFCIEEGLGDHRDPSAALGTLWFFLPFRLVSSARKATSMPPKPGYDRALFVPHTIFMFAN